MKKIFILTFWTLILTSSYQFLRAQNGNIGIGTTDPQAKLHVAGDMQLDNRLVLKDSLGNDRIIIDPDNALFQMLDTSANVIINLSLNGNEQKGGKGTKSSTSKNSGDPQTPTYERTFNETDETMVESTRMDSYEMRATYNLQNLGVEHIDENEVVRYENNVSIDQQDESFFDENGNLLAQHSFEYTDNEFIESYEFFDPDDLEFDPIMEFDLSPEGFEVEDPVSGDKLNLNAVGTHSENSITGKEYFNDADGTSLFEDGFFVGVGYDVPNSTVNIEGNLNVQGDINKPGSTFKIDHPQDPTNKWLYHSSIESPDRMNVYNGNITTNLDGEAIVELPGYFNDLNKEFRYQLTPIGVFAQAIVSKKVENNQFEIKTSEPNVEVSWQITGIRQDDFAKDNPIEVEAPKLGWDKGKRLYDTNRKAPYTKDLQNHQVRFDENRN